MALKVIDLFCGVGGLSYGFANNQNFKIVAANEILPQMAKAYALNHQGVKVFVDDIKNFGADRVKEELGVYSEEIDIVVGGPPCQAYSTVGKRLADDPRGKLFQEYYRVIKEFNPQMFVFENVKGLLSMQGGELFATIIQLFESLGYRTYYKLLNAADYGTPQIRERVIIIGTKLKSEFSYPEPTHGDTSTNQDLFWNSLKPYRTLEDAISDLPFIKTGEEGLNYQSQPQNDFQEIMRNGAPQKIMDHNAPNNNPNLVKLMELLPDGGTPEDLPLEMRPKSGFKNTYCRLWWQKPATTITRNLGTPSSSRCIHPKVPRPLTTREGARLQGFPYSYKFYGSRGDKNLQIGNAVPTMLSQALAKSIEDNFRKDSLL